jgi:PBSX family phage portal protein
VASLEPPADEHLDLDGAIRGLSDRVALIKAHVLGTERVAESNAMPWADADQREQVFAGMGVIPPPYDPETLAILFENSSSLRQNVDAYVTNIDAFGHRFEPVIDLDASDADHRIANALFIERERLKRDPRNADDDAIQGLPDTPTPEEVAAKRAEVAEHMRIERSRLESFFDFSCIDLSFVTLRRRTRQDVEVMGNGYWEVLRDGGGELAQFVYLPAFTMRLLPLDLALVEDELNVKISEIAFDTMKVRRRFRRFVQVFEQQVVYFKELGDPRLLSRKSGAVFKSIEELLANDPTDGPATEVLHFKLHNARSAYGTPRWIGNLLSVLGTRQAEEVNYLYFQNKSVPPLAILVSGGRLSAQSVPRIESYIENHIKGKHNFFKILVLEAESPGNGSFENAGRMRIELKPLTNAQHTDALFSNYDERNSDKVGQSFRLPRLLRGDIRDFNRSCYSADTETLTEHGWKLVDDIHDGERIAAYDLSTDSIVYVVPASRHVHEVDEEMVHFVNRHVDILVTADHRMLVRPNTEDHGVWQVRTAEQLTHARFDFRVTPERHTCADEPFESFALPRDPMCRRARGHDHGPVSGDVWLEFVGYFVSDGGVRIAPHPTLPYVVYLDQKKPATLARMRACLDRLGWRYSVQTQADGMTRMLLSNRCLRAWLTANCGLDTYTRQLPPEYVFLGERQLVILLNALMLGDGHLQVGKKARWGSYSTSSRILAEQVQRICLHLGLRARVRETAVPSGRPFYDVYICHRQTAALARKDVRRVQYRGRVYCFSVPEYGFFVTRRNGKVAIQGNTGDAALMFAEMQVFQPEREEFDFVVNRKVLSDMGIRFWRFRSNSPVTRDPAAMAEIVRSLVNASILTPEEGRLLASDVFNREFKKISASWVKQPVALTLAGIQPTPEPESTLAGPDVQKDAGTGELAAAGPAARSSRRRRADMPDLAAEAARLITIRDALRAAEDGANKRAFDDAKRVELDHEVIKVPAEELASWFEKESTSP